MALNAETTERSLRRDSGSRADGNDPLAHRIGNPLLIGPAVAGGAQGLDRLGTAESHRDLAKFRDAAIAGQGLQRVDYT